MRKIQFKAKSLECIYWICGHLKHKNYISKDDNTGSVIDPSTLCQLITEINGVKIFEYDCYYYKGLASYSYYNHKGILTVSFINFITNDLIIPDCEASEDDLIYKDFDKFTFIGNWHDGEQFLLDKIKGI